METTTLRPATLHRQSHVCILVEKLVLHSNMIDFDHERLVRRDDHAIDLPRPPNLSSYCDLQLRRMPS